MSAPGAVLVLGATGRTGRHFVDLALRRGQQVRALVRDPAAMAAGGLASSAGGPAGAAGPGLDVRRGDVTDPGLLHRPERLDELVAGVDAVVCMLGDVRLQKDTAVCADLVRQLVPAMRRQGVTRLLYQAGALSRPPAGQLPLPLRAVRAAMGPGYRGQHRDNEAVMTHLVEQAGDLQWVVHRAGIGGDGASRGVLRRSTGRPSIATFADCAAYSHLLLESLLTDPAVAHSCDTSTYRPAEGPDLG